SHGLPARCSFHCFPVDDSQPSPSCLHVTFVSDDLYGHVGAQYTPEARPFPIAPRDVTWDGNRPVFAIWPIFTCFVYPCWAACRQKVAKSGGIGKVLKIWQSCWMKRWI